MSVVLGAIADDFTGATDLASTWAREGVEVCQVIGVPDGTTDVGKAQAVVVALKSRTARVADAVRDSLAALEWLRQMGASQILFKYCSTFDSTPTGNIGPVADALGAALDTDFAFVCPAFPANGRTVYNGHLFVGEQLLSESPMRDHPLTPMRDSNLIQLLSAQSRHAVGLIPLPVVRAGVDRIRSEVDKLRMSGVRYGVVDAVSETDLRQIGAAAAEHSLVTGGSGIGMGLPENFRGSGKLVEAVVPDVPNVAGRTLVLAGSCSAATRSQVAAVAGRWPTRQLQPAELLSDAEVVDATVSWAVAQTGDAPVLIYTSADPATVASVQSQFGAEEAGHGIEIALSRIARALAGAGFSRIIVAGGETSGAVVSALGVGALRIGPEIAPGVPWTESVGSPVLALALKSGNFGGENFFADAHGMLP